ncbi:hypothetical protein GCM10028819_22840 [Spirosoma humi]
MVIRNGGTVVHSGVGMTPAPVVQRDHAQIRIGAMIAPGSVGTMIDRNSLALLIATGPALIGTTATAAHGIAPEMTDHVSIVVRMIAPNLTDLPMVTVLGLAGITTGPGSIGLPTVIAREGVAGIRIVQNSTALLTVIGLVLIAMTVPIVQPVPDLVAINPPVRHASTGKIARTSVIGTRTLPAFRTIEAGAMIDLGVTVQNGKNARMVIAHA